MNRFVTVKVVARMFGISERTCRRWASKGILPTLKIGGARRFDVHDLEVAIREPTQQNGGSK